MEMLEGKTGQNTKTELYKRAFLRHPPLEVAVAEAPRLWQAFALDNGGSVFILTWPILLLSLPCFHHTVFFVEAFAIDCFVAATPNAVEPDNC